jgi:hypothetical protein
MSSKPDAKAMIAEAKRRGDGKRCNPDLTFEGRCNGCLAHDLAVELEKVEQHEGYLESIIWSAYQELSDEASAINQRDRKKDDESTKL